MSAPFKSSTVPRRRCGTFADMRASGDRAALLAESALALFGVRRVLQAKDRKRQSNRKRDRGTDKHRALPPKTGDQFAADRSEHGAAEVGTGKNDAEKRARVFLKPVVDEDRPHKICNERESETDHVARNKPAVIAGIQ